MMLDDTPPGPIILVYEVPNIEKAIEMFNLMKFRKYLSIFGSVDTLKNAPLERLQCGGLFLNKAPTDTVLLSDWGFTSNIANGGSDLKLIGS